MLLQEGFRSGTDLLHVIYSVHEAQTLSVAQQACWSGASKSQIEGIAVSKVFRRGLFVSAETEGEDEEQKAAVQHLDMYNIPLSTPS